MTVADLIAQLVTMDPSLAIHLRVADAGDAAYSNDVAARKDYDDENDVGCVVLEGWVSPTNPQAFAPWAPED